MQNEQKILLEHLAKDDDVAYTLLYEQFYVPMVLFASKYIRDEEAAKDVVQAVSYTHLIRKIFTFAWPLGRLVFLVRLLVLTSWWLCMIMITICVSNFSSRITPGE